MEKAVSTTSQLKPLSASRVKTLENCSWLYWVNYHLKLPQIQNDGAKKGEVCHSIFECLLHPRHLKHFKSITEKGSVTASKSVYRLIKFYIKRLKLPIDSFELIDKMIVVGLKTDFFVKDGKLVSAEFEFNLISESPRYHMRGFMDKVYIVGDTIIIDDFKSSKKKFEGEDEESNLQALMYSLAASQLWPTFKPIVRFIFLQFPDDPLMTVQFSPDTLKGLEYYLADAQTKVSNFTEKDAKRHFAADYEPPKGEFKGKLLCGFAKRPDQLKKDGTKMWYCAYKFPFDYYAILKSNGEIAYTVFKKEEAKLKDGEKIELRHYEGCPKHRNALDGFSTAPSAGVPKKFTNVLDDF